MNNLKYTAAELYEITQHINTLLDNKYRTRAGFQVRPRDGKEKLRRYFRKLKILYKEQTKELFGPTMVQQFFANIHAWVDPRQRSLSLQMAPRNVSPNVIEACLQNGMLLKKIMRAISAVVTDVNFQCTEQGMSLITMDIDHSVLVSMFLRAEGFE